MAEIPSSQPDSAPKSAPTGTTPSKPPSPAASSKRVVPPTPALQRWMRGILRQLPGLIIMVFLFLCVRSSIVDWNDVPSQSMYPGILIGDRVFVNKLAYGLRIPFTYWEVITWNHPKRGEIVIVFSPKEETRLVKRLVAVPGDTISMVNGVFIVNGEPATYAPSTVNWAAEFPPREWGKFDFYDETVAGVTHPVQRVKAALVGAPRNMEPRTLGPDEYWAMGDNRDESGDSRSFGAVKRNRIVGRSSAIAFSLDYENMFMPRWSRFFKALP